VEDAPGLARALGEVAQVGDHVVAGLALQLGDPLEVDLGRRAAERGELLVGDRQPQLALRLGERQPQPPPQPEAVPGGEQLRHPPRGVALVQRVLGGFARAGHGRAV
jgi:hypothetical protein